MSKILFDAEEIKNIIPHRYPFLFLNSILDYKINESIVGEMVINDDLFYLKGHFPDFPITPGVIIIEALAQACLVMAELDSCQWSDSQPIKNSNRQDELWVLSKVKINLIKPVIPHINIQLYGKINWKFGNSAEFQVKANNDDIELARGVLICSKSNKSSLIKQTT